VSHGTIVPFPDDPEDRNLEETKMATDDLRDVVGDVFQQTTKYERETLRGRALDWVSKPETYKTYPPDLARVALPEPEVRGGPPLWDAVAGRRSRRSFSREPVALGELSQLLWTAQGVTARHQDVELRAAPSAGALYPIETYVAINHVADTEPGVYHYDVRRHELICLSAGDHRGQVAAAALDQKMAASAGVVFIWTAVAARSKWKYKQRAYRYVYLDAGHIGHAVALTAEALGLGCCAIAALYDDEVNALVGVDGENETVVYMTVVGKTGEHR